MRPLLATILYFVALCSLLMAQGPVHLSLLGQSTGDEFGSHLAGHGDADGDGIPDILIAAPFDDTGAPDGGRAVLVSGATGLPIQDILGSSPNQRFGSAVAGLSDVDSDGHLDFAVATVDDSTHGLDSGLVEAYSGATGQLLYVIPGLVGGGKFGRGLARVADIDADGWDDLIIGASGGMGLVVVHSGFDGTQLLQWSGVSLSSKFGAVVADAGDTDLDGTVDILVGALLDDHAGIDSGSAYLYSGSTGLLLHRFDGISPGDRFGRAVDSLGDVDGDGAADVVVTSIDLGGVAYARGYSGLTGATLFTVYGDVGDDFGHAVAGIGDANGDGFRDFCVGVPDADEGGLMENGCVRFFSGTDGSFLGHSIGQSAGEGMGYSVASIGDINSDGFDDVLTGSLPFPTAPGLVRCACAAGSLVYGTSTTVGSLLNLDWLVGLPSNPSQGVVQCSGAGLSAAGVGLFGVGKGDTWMSGVNVIVNTAPGSYGVFNLAFDSIGKLWLPIDLQQPALAGQSIFLQCFEFSTATPQGVFASNALELVFSF